MTRFEQGRLLGWVLFGALVFVVVVGVFFVWESPPARELPPINSISHEGPQPKPTLVKAARMRMPGEVVLWRGPSGQGCGVFYMHPDELEKAGVPAYAAPRGLFLYQGNCRVVVAR